MKKLVVACALAGLLVGAPAYAAGPCVTLTRALSFGMTDTTAGGEVSLVQKFLGVITTGYYGPVTRSAVEKWQLTHAIAAPGVSGYGMVGPKTRASMACGVVTTPTVASTTPITGIIDQNGATLGGSFTLSGTVASSTVTVWVVPQSYVGPTDLMSLGALMTLYGVSGFAHVQALATPSGVWSAHFAADSRGFQFPNGTYRALVFPCATACGASATGRFTVQGSTNPLLTCSIGVSRVGPPVGIPVTLSWTSTSASSATQKMSYQSGSTTPATPVATVGTTTVAVNEDTTFTFTFYGKGTSTSCSITITPQQP